MKFAVALLLSSSSALKLNQMYDAYTLSNEDMADVAVLEKEFHKMEKRMN